MSHLADGECGGPLGPQDVQADRAVGVDVGVVDPRGESHLGEHHPGDTERPDLGGLEGVVGGEVDRQEEHSALVGTVRRAHDGSLKFGSRAVVQ